MSAGGGILFTVLLLMEGCYLLFASAGVWLFVSGMRRCNRQEPTLRLPRVSCIVTCYAEGAAVRETIASLVNQTYAGEIDILMVVDGAFQNQATLAAATRGADEFRRCRGRRVTVLAKWVRGGRASSLNAGLALATGEIVMALDGDTSFDRRMVGLGVRHFESPGVIGLAGTLCVRNAGQNVLTRLQSLDYLIYRQYVRAGLGAFNVVNNIPGAHGLFRADILRRVGGWDTGAAEDVDLTWRLRKYFGRYPHLRIAADPHVLSFTDVPTRWTDFLMQRLRWEGDPVYLYLRKHWSSLKPGLLGWRNFLFAAWYGVTYQIVMPLLLLVAVLELSLCTDADWARIVLLKGYLFLLGAFGLVVGADLGWISERPREDLRAAAWLPVYPLFFLMLRLWSAAAVLHSLLLRSHLDSSMAPWWVLRRGKF